MKKTAAMLLLAFSGCAGAKTLPAENLQGLYEAYATLNTCHQYGYTGDEALTALDKLIRSNRYQDNTGNIMILTKDNINYYHSFRTALFLSSNSKAKE
jgi:tRNA uridine 5-carbamoylmethylation protein Kti12